MNQCPCGSKAEYDQCCGPYISGMKNPPTAEILMRARYSAYVKGEIDFIESTHSLEERDSLSVEETRKWSEESEWLGLEIIETEAGGEQDETGVVEFKANFKQEGNTYVHHERSTFKKLDGKWLFKDGKNIPQIVTREGDKVGRNDPCPCGSGKKYKKCCMKKAG